jgi:hypothetical protein
MPTIVPADDAVPDTNAAICAAGLCWIAWKASVVPTGLMIDTLPADTVPATKAFALLSWTALVVPVASTPLIVAVAADR